MCQHSRLVTILGISGIGKTALALQLLEQIKDKKLQGLDLSSAKEILRKKSLVEEDKWQYLIEKYQGNPLWLKIISTMIQDLVGGRVREFIKYDNLLLNEDLKDILNQEFDRLSDIEKQIVYSVAAENEAVVISQLLSHLQLPASELMNAMQSLGRRSLICKITQGNETLFSLQPVVKQYVKVRVNER